MDRRAAAPRPEQQQDPSTRPYSTIHERAHTTLPCRGGALGAGGGGGGREGGGGGGGGEGGAGGGEGGGVEVKFRSWITIKPGVTYM